MAITVTHAKTSTIAVDPVAEARGEVTPDDWNEGHSFTGLDELEDNVRTAVVVNMAGDDYTLTYAEATAAYIVIINGGTGKTLTWPTTADSFVPVIQAISTGLTTADVTLAFESGGSTGTAFRYQGGINLFLMAPGTSFTNVTDQISDYARNYNGDQAFVLNDLALVGSPATGQLEHRDDAFFGTTTADNRGVIPAEHITINQAQVSLNDDTNAQSPFAAGADTLTLPVGTYKFESMIAVITGSTSHTNAFGIAGTATIGDILYQASTRNGARGTAATGVQTNFAETESATAMNTATGATNQTHYIRGHFTVTGAGTIIPQITFSAAPGSTNTCETMSYFKVTSLGAETTASVGAWA